MSGLRGFDDWLSREPDYTTSSPCPACGCAADDAWGCDCTNPYCPCSEPEDDEEDG